ncbi:hypothetical protein THRCLA_10964 [Thraustotheca clavata]|uniref:HSF-type DNA-binding domain-containing protein n=1 Tax=Thraustotheca clavata TaxID=74557 RepID=A0A1V9YCA1_9STRA|nr:hypothetical protein THRCLA_10964 [Thraustotheca clavata]
MMQTTIDELKRKRITGIPKFLRSLYRMLDSEDPSIITWSHDGTAIQILSERRLEKEILRKYFNHEKASSFQRQLNNFGFRKWTKTQSNVCTFSHPYFLRTQPELLVHVVRKSPRTSPRHDNNQENTPPADIFSFDDPKFVDAIAVDCSPLKLPKSSQDLWDVFQLDDPVWDMENTNNNAFEFDPDVAACLLDDKIWESLLPNQDEVFDIENYPMH